MKGMIPKKEAEKIERAIVFLVDNVKKSGKNPKPVILHSLETAFYLLERDYKSDLVIAAILHDILEDTGVGEDDLSQEFGDKITDLVKSVSYKEEIEDWTKKYQDVFSRTLGQGKDALILKCADIYHNGFYIKLVEDMGFQKRLVEKMGCFLKASEGSIENEAPWQDLKKQYELENKRVNS